MALIKAEHAKQVEAAQQEKSRRALEENVPHAAREDYVGRATKQVVPAQSGGLMAALTSLSMSLLGCKVCSPSE